MGILLLLLLPNTGNTIGIPPLIGFDSSNNALLDKNNIESPWILQDITVAPKSTISNQLFLLSSFLRFLSMYKEFLTLCLLILFNLKSYLLL